jgi:protease-4
VNSTTLRSLAFLPVLLAAAPYRPGALSSVAPDGVASLLANPAGIGLLDGPEFEARLSGGRPFGQDAILAGLPRFAAGWEQHTTNSDTTRERAFLAGTGATFGERLSLGALAVRHELGGSTQGWSLDAGVLWRPFRQISASWTSPDVFRRDPTRDRTNTFGLGLRPLGSPRFELAFEGFLAGAPWNRSAWDEPSWELGARIRPLPWLGLEGRLDPEHPRQYGIGARIQFTPELGFFVGSAPDRSGSRFQSAGLRWTTKSRQSVNAVDGVVHYKVPNPPSEAPSGNFWQQRPGLSRVRDDFQELSSMRQVKTVVLDLGATRFSPVQAGVLRRMVLDLRNSGKRVQAWANDLDMANLHILSACDKAAISPQGTVRSRGLAMDVLYFGKLLKNHGVAVQVVKTGPWKSAMEPFEKASMSEASRENLSRYLFDLDSMILGSAAQSRKIDPAKLVAYVDTGSLLPSTAKAIGLVDTLLDHEDLRKWAPGRILSPRLAGIHRETWGGGQRVAVVVLEGQIIDHAGEAGMVPWNKSLVAETVARRLDALKSDQSIAAVVLRIQSPGGSVTGSERLRRAVERLAKQKPVVASFGNTAASGAYMLALPATRIFTEPEAMVGSIGVFAAKASVAGLLDSFGIRVERVRTAPHAGASSPYAALDSLEEARLTQFVEDAHQRFADEVMRSRRMDTAAFRKVGGGRIFSGARAVDLSLADTLGGMDEAVRWAQGRTGVSSGSMPVWFDAKSTSWNFDAASAAMALSGQSAATLPEAWSRWLRTPRALAWSQCPWEPTWE